MMPISDKLRAKLLALPDRPGVYLLRDASGRIVYVGKAKSLRKRVGSYFRPGAVRRGDAKQRGLIRSVADLDVLPLRSEAEAALTEGRLIKEYRPRFNVGFKDDKRFLLLRLDPGEPFPRIEARRLAREDGAWYFGPYPHSAAARAAMSFAQRRFGLRVCRPRRPGPEDHRHCHSDILRTCAAPCVGRIEPEAYRGRALDAAAFLRGERPEVLRELREEMRREADALHFEKAAALRDTIRRLDEALARRLRMGRPPALRAEDARRGLVELRDRLGLPRAPGTIECVDVSNISGAHAVAGWVSAAGGRPAPSRYRRFRIRTVSGIHDPAMIAEAVRRRFRPSSGPPRPPPDLLLVDGGITQLRAARAALREADRADVPVAGLSKRFEELIWGPAGREVVLRLPDDSPALRILRRLRDEAHRFALAYHHALRGRRIRESVLDDIPGIGPRKKAALLRRFGSVARLRAASVDEVAAAPGIGRKLAETALDHLGRDTGASPVGATEGGP